MPDPDPTWLNEELMCRIMGREPGRVVKMVDGAAVAVTWNGAECAPTQMGLGPGVSVRIALKRDGLGWRHCVDVAVGGDPPLVTVVQSWSRPTSASYADAARAARADAERMARDAWGHVTGDGMHAATAPDAKRWGHDGLGVLWFAHGGCKRCKRAKPRRAA